LPGKAKVGQIVALRRRNRLVLFRATSTRGAWRIAGNISLPKPVRKRNIKGKTRVARAVREKAVPMNISEPAPPQVVVVEKETPPKANSSALGFIAMGLTIVFFGMGRVGITQFFGNVLLVSIMFFTGGVLQLVASLLEFRRGGTFETTVFGLYGAFWLTIAATMFLPSVGLLQPVNSETMGLYYLIWTILSAYIFILSLKLTAVRQSVFLTLTIMFFFLVVAEFTGLQAIEVLAGGDGIFCGFITIYLGFAEARNEIEGRPILPV